MRMTEIDTYLSKRRLRNDPLSPKKYRVTNSVRSYVYEIKRREQPETYFQLEHHPQPNIRIGTPTPSAGVVAYCTPIGFYIVVLCWKRVNSNNALCISSNYSCIYANILLFREIECQLHWKLWITRHLKSNACRKSINDVMSLVSGKKS